MKQGQSFCSPMASKSLIVLLVLLLIGILPRTVSSISMEELDATLAGLRSRGHNLFSNAITTSDVVFDLLSSSSLTILLPTESSLFALDMTQPASFYVNTLRCHIIPRRLTLAGLLRLVDGSYLPTLLPSRELRVSRRRVGGVDVVALDGVDVVVPGIFNGRHIAVHGLDGIFSYRSLISGFNPQIPPVLSPSEDGAEQSPHNSSVVMAPAPEVEISEGLSPADLDFSDLPPISFRPRNAPVSESPISESPEVSPISEPPEIFPSSPSPVISPLSPQISPSSGANQSLDRLAPHMFLTEEDGPIPPSPSIGDEISEAKEDLPPTTLEMLWNTDTLPDISESPEITPNPWSPEMPPTSESFSTEISPSLQSKVSLGHFVPSVFSPENEDPKPPSPSTGYQFPEEKEDVPSATSKFLSDVEIPPNSWSPEIPSNSWSPEIPPNSHSEPSLGHLDPPMPLPPSPSDGENFPDTVTPIIPAPPEFLRDSFRDTAKLSPPARPVPWMPPTELFNVPPVESIAGDIPPSVGFAGEFPEMRPPLKGEKTTGVKMQAPKQSWPSAGGTIECLLTVGDSVSCDLDNGHADYPTAYPR